MVMMVEGILRISRWLLESGYWSTVVFIQFISDHHVVDRLEIFLWLATCNTVTVITPPCEYSNIYRILISTFVFQPPTVSVLSPRTGDSATITSQSCLGVNSVGKIISGSKSREWPSPHCLAIKGSDSVSVPGSRVSVQMDTEKPQ